MFKIHDYMGFPNPTRIRIAISEKGLSDQVSFVSVDLPAGEHKSVAFLSRKPAGTVPVLELEDGTHISECTAITEFLDHFTGQPTLTGRTARERAMIHMMQRRAEAGLLDAVATYFHHATPGLGPHIETAASGVKEAWTERSPLCAILIRLWSIGPTSPDANSPWPTLLPSRDCCTPTS